MATSALVGSAILFTPAAHAAAAAETTAVTGVEEVIVTAERREANLQKVPQAVSVVSPAALQAQNVVDVRQLMRIAPTFVYQVASTGLNQTLTMRGVGTFTGNFNFQLSVGVAQDGVAAGRIVQSVPDIVDVQRIEVLKGPQGLLFGKNSSAGLINIITNKPVLGTFDGNVRGEVGGKGERQLSGVANIPVGDTLAVRATVWNYQQGGLIDTITQPGAERGGKDSSGIRLGVLWKPTDSFDAFVRGQWVRQHDDGPAAVLIKFAPGNFTAANLGAQIQANTLAAGITPSFKNNKVNSVSDTFHKQRDSLYIADLNYHLGDGGTITSTSSRSHTEVTYKFDPYNFNTSNPVSGGEPLISTQTITQYTQELRYTSPADQPVKFVAGLYYDHLKLFDRGSLQSQNQLSGVRAAYAGSEVGRFTSKAAFANATWSITDALRLTGGLRYTDDKMTARMNRVNLYSTVNGVPTVVPGLTSAGSPFGPFTAAGGASSNALTGRVSVDYDVAPQILTYAAYARGYKAASNIISGNTVPASLDPATNGRVKPEFVDLYEAGVKSRFFDNRLQVNAAVFHEVFSDFQTSARLASVTSTVVFVIQNAKQAKTTGVEADVQAVLAPGLTLNGAVAYTNARFTDFANAPCYAGQTAALGCVGGQQNVNGHRMPLAPRFAGSLGLRYEHDLTEDYKGFVDVNGVYRSSTRYEQTGDPNQLQKGYGLVNLATGVETADGRAKLTLSVRNLFDKYYVDRIIITTGNYGYAGYPVYGSFRTFSAALDVKF